MAFVNAYTKFGHVLKMRYRTERLLYVYTRENLNDGITQIRFKTDIWYLWVFIVFQFVLVNEVIWLDFIVIKLKKQLNLKVAIIISVAIELNFIKMF